MFVANPKKPPQIETILRRNKDKLLKFLKDFHNDKEGKIQIRVCVPHLLTSATDTIMLDTARRAIYGESVQRA